MSHEGVTAPTRPRAAKRRRLDTEIENEDDAYTAAEEIDYAKEINASTKYSAELEHA